MVRPSSRRLPRPSFTGARSCSTGRWLVWPLPAPIGWTAVSLRVVPDAIATLRASVLSLHLQGSLYEQTTSRS
ncbi:Uncharacterised protein [Bordetella pertussis]|nr:Uncharacterised protein [Bordetella pertussis]